MADKGLFSDMGDKTRKKLEMALAIGVIAIALLLLLPGLNLGGDAETASGSIFDASAEQKALKQTLSAIKGAGKVEVMITYRAKENAQPAATAETGSFGIGLGSSAGDRDSASGQRPDVLGVIVVAEGAEDISVKMALAGAVQTALGVTADRVDVYEMKK